MHNLQYGIMHERGRNSVISLRTTNSDIHLQGHEKKLVCNIVWNLPQSILLENR